MKIAAIAKRVGLKPKTCSHIIRHWRLNNYSVDSLYEGRRRQPMRFTQVQIQWITCPITLKEMISLSLAQRVEIIKNRCAFSQLAESTLRLLYKKHKVKFLAPRYCYIAKMKKAERILEQQKIFTEKVTKLRMESRIIVFADESSFNL